MSSTFGVEQLALPFLADLGDQGLSRVSALLRGRQQLPWLLPLAALLLPVPDRRLHAHHVGVAHLGQPAGRARGAAADRAVQQERRVLVRHDLADALGDVAKRQQGRSGDVARVPLALLANVDDADSRRAPGPPPRRRSPRGRVVSGRLVMVSGVPCCAWATITGRIRRRGLLPRPANVPRRR